LQTFSGEIFVDVNCKVLLFLFFINFVTSLEKIWISIYLTNSCMFEAGSIARQVAVADGLR